MVRNPFAALPCIAPAALLAAAVLPSDPRGALLAAGDVSEWLAFARPLLPWAVAAMVALFVLAALVRPTRGGLIDRLRWRLRVALGRGHDVDELARRLGMRALALRALAPTYREVEVRKRSGGVRTLQIPDDATKALQRTILRRLLAKLRAHEAAHAFERGRSIVTNALPHVGQAIVIRLDVVDFFPSTRADRVEHYFRRVGWNAEASALLTRLTTYQGGLPQGAPTSPRLANLVNGGLDAQLARRAARRGARYTRYADDITFSFAKDRSRWARGLIEACRRHLKGRGYALHGRKKTHVRRRHQRQEVTGLVVNDRVALPRERRRWLRAVRHRAAMAGAAGASAGRGEATLTPEALAGWESYAAMVRGQAGVRPRSA